MIYESILENGVITPFGLTNVPSIVGVYSAVPINVTPVSDYYYEGTDQEYFDLASDFPNVAPPFQDMFLFTRRPKHIVSAETGVHDATKALPPSWGVLVQSINSSEFKESTFDGGVGSSKEALTAYNEIRSKAEIYVQKGAKWLSFGYHYMENEYGVAVGPCGMSIWGINPDGTITRNTTEEGKTAVLVASMGAEKAFGSSSSTDFGNALVGLLKPLLLGVCFMNCRNVTLVDESLPRRTRRRLEKQDQPLPKHKVKTLQIEAMTHALRSEGGQDENGLRKALHICRGHFKTYSGKGLFGRYPGTYWWGPQLRGNSESGVVSKNYVVNPARHQE